MWSGIVAPGDSVLGVDYSSRRILVEVAYEAKTRPKLFGTGGHCFAVAALSYEASEPPRGVARVMLIRTHSEKVRRTIF